MFDLGMGLTESLSHSRPVAGIGLQKSGGHWYATAHYQGKAILGHGKSRDEALDDLMVSARGVDPGEDELQALEARVSEARGQERLPL